MKEQKSFKDLEVWQKSMLLVEDIYKVAKNLPAEERYALSDQLRRAAVSVPSNLAEGQRRFSKKEMVRYAGMSLGSLGEVETQLLLSKKLYGIEIDDILKECEIISRMILALIKSQRIT